MFKPTIVSFINFYFIDSIPFNVLFQGAAFAWDYRYFKERYNDHKTREIVSQCVQLVVGILIAQLFRWLQNRHKLSWSRFSLFNYQTVLRIIISFIAVATLEQYDNKIQEAPYGFCDPFPIGIFRALLWYITLFILIEIYQEAIAKKISKQKSAFTFESLNTVAMAVGLLIGVVDLFFSNAWVPMLIFIGFFAAALVSSGVFARIFAV